jgi:hypothetical protein
VSRRGRKRQLVKRQPNGQPARNIVQHREDMQSVVLTARQRVFRVNAETAIAMPETSFLGRLLATGELSRRQYDTATSYQEHRREYDRLFPVRQYPEAANLDRSGGHDNRAGDEPEYVAYCRIVQETDRRCERALFDADREDRDASNMVELIVMKGERFGYGVGSLRIGLNWLARALDIPGQIVARKAVSDFAPAG